MDAAATLLEAAFTVDTVAVKDALLVAGVHIDHTDTKGNSAISLASNRIHTAVVELLLAYEANVNLNDRDGYSALMFACWNGYKTIVEMLLVSCATVDHVNTRGETPLVRAAEDGHAWIVDRLLTAGASVDRVNNGYCALMFEMLSGYTDVVRSLRAAGAKLQLFNAYEFAKTECNTAATMRLFSSVESTRSL